MGAVAGRCLADHDQIDFHGDLPRSLFESSLSQDALLGFLVQLGVHLTRNRNASPLYKMLVLPVAALGFDSIPAIGFDELYDLSDFHPFVLPVTTTALVPRDRPAGGVRRRHGAG